MKKKHISTYKPQRRRNLYSSSDHRPYKLSRSKINNFLKCPRCFYLDRKCGTVQPPPYPYTLNSAVDTLLKKEFDQYRATSKPHPLFIKHGLDAIPFSHQNLDDWRMNQKGIQYLHKPTNFNITGAIDDVWINPQKNLIIIADYKATSTKQEITLDNRDSYKKQMEIYQWLFRKNGFKVANKGYFVYCNCDTEKNAFTGILQFKISLIPYDGNDSWIEKILHQIKDCLTSKTIPEPSPSCEYCQYLNAIKKHVETNNTKRKSN
jgi:CRISPR/Cas system-associated exonuclease Cas4 (RecB family)